MVDDPKQILLLTTKKGKVVGKANRLRCHEGRGLPHLAFIGFVKNKNGQFVLTKRSHEKTLWAGFWDAAVVSHVFPGENSLSAGLRRSKEEIGVEVNFKRLGGFYYYAKQNGFAENEYCDVLLGLIDEGIRPNEEEIDAVSLRTIKELNLEVRTVNKQKYTPWFLLAYEKFKKKLN